jgi:hypothetical protein
VGEEKPEEEPLGEELPSSKRLPRASMERGEGSYATYSTETR